jgi:hypothetical protein
MSNPSLLHRFLFEGSSPERLAATRILLGLGLIPFFWMQYDSVLDFALSGPRWYYLDPVWYFDALGLRRHAPWLAVAGFAALLCALPAFALGLRTRAAALAILVLVLFLKGARDSVAGDIHHRELVPFHALLFFALSRCGDVYSCDARWRPSSAVREWEASWPIRASQLYVASFYWWSGFAKLRASGTAWFEGGTALQALLLGRAVRYGIGSDGEPAGSSLGLWLAGYPELLALLGVGVTAMELAFPLLLLRSLWLRVALVGGATFFHVANYLLLNVQFLYLPVVFVLFFDVGSLLRRLGRLTPSASPSPLR